MTTPDRPDLVEVGCPKCKTILNAEAARCDGAWHSTNGPDLVEVVARAMEQCWDAKPDDEPGAWDLWRADAAHVLAVLSSAGALKPDGGQTREQRWRVVFDGHRTGTPIVWSYPKDASASPPTPTAAPGRPPGRRPPMQPHEVWIINGHDEACAYMRAFGELDGYEYWTCECDDPDAYRHIDEIQVRAAAPIIAAQALRQTADEIDRGPTFPLPPSVISELVRERAETTDA